MMTPLKDIHALLDAAVKAGNAASDAISSHAANPFAVMVLQRTRLATSEHRKSRDELKVAMKQIARKEVPPLISNIAGEMKSQAAALKPVDIPLKRSKK
jgi:hypothetical protein